MSSERLFALQLRLKKDRENRIRKIEETNRLRASYEEQILIYMYSMLKEITLICPYLYSNDENIDAKIDKGTKIDSQKFLEIFTEAKDNFIKTYEKNYAVSNSNAKSSMFIMGINNFFWSEEYCNEYANLLFKASQAIAPKLCPSLIFVPHLQIFFINALKPVFREFTQKVSIELADIFKETIVKYKPIFPVFVRKILKNLDSPAVVFWESFCLPIIKNYHIFGLAHPELSLFAHSTLDDFIEELSTFFQSDEGDEFVQSIIRDEDSVTIMPKEELFYTISPEYSPKTLIIGSAFKILVGDKKVSLPNLGILQTKSPRTDAAKLKSIHLDNYKGYIREFLLKADLFKVESSPTSSIGWLTDLMQLSSIYGDPDLQDLIDKIGPSIEKKSIDTIIKEISDDLDDEAAAPEENPLNLISQYSAQSAYIARLIEFVDNFEQKVTDVKQFDNAKRIAGSFISKGNEISLSDASRKPKVFVDYFIKAVEFAKEYEKEGEVKVDASFNRSLFTVLGSKLGLFQAVTVKDSLRNADDDLHSYIDKNRKQLMDSLELEFLKPFKEDPTKLKLFTEEFGAAFETPIPFTRIDHIHTSFNALSGMLQLAGMAEIGADQVVPFFIVAAATVNPFGLATTDHFLSEYIVPLFNTASPLDHSAEYSVVQFLSMCQYIKKMMGQK